MALSTYSDLVTAIGDWLDDSSLSSQADIFIRLAEARFNRLLRTPDMETAATITATAETATLPTGFQEMRALWIDGAADSPLEQTTLINLKAQYAATGIPMAYAIGSGTLWLGPAPASSTSLTAIYYKSLTGLSGSNTTNWLLDAHPDAYLLGCLVAAELRGWNDDRLPLLKSALDEALGEIERNGNSKRHGGSPLVAKAPASNQVRGVRI